MGKEINQTRWTEQREHVPDGKMGEKLLKDRRLEMDRKSRRNVDGNMSVQWDKCTDSNFEDSNYTETVNIFDILAMYVVSYIPKEVTMGEVIPKT